MKQTKVLRWHLCFYSQIYLTFMILNDLEYTLAAFANGN